MGSRASLSGGRATGTTRRVLLDNPLTCARRYILCTTDIEVGYYNRAILYSVSGNTQTRYATDAIKERDSACGSTEHQMILEYAHHAALRGVRPFVLDIKRNAVHRMLEPTAFKDTLVVVEKQDRGRLWIRPLQQSGSFHAVPLFVFEAALPLTQHTIQRWQFPLVPAYASLVTDGPHHLLEMIGLDLTGSGDTFELQSSALSPVRRLEHCSVLRPTSPSTALDETV